jgi:hypothetical protein
MKRGRSEEKEKDNAEAQRTQRSAEKKGTAVPCPYHN